MAIPTLYSQSDSLTNQYEEVINNLLDESTETSDNSELYDNVEELLNNPIDINSAQINDLEKIPSIDFTTARLIIEYRVKHGKFSSPQELYNIKGLTGEKAKLIIPFVKVNHSKKNGPNKNRQKVFPSWLINNSKLNVRSRTTKKLQKTRNYPLYNFMGSPYKFYNRFNYKVNNYYKFGFLTEKDPGEKSFYDFTSYYLSIKHLSVFNNIVLGDYMMEFGQGLALWSSYGYSKGNDAIYPVKKNGRGIVPYTSSGENKFFRGIAATINFDNFNLTSFYSLHQFDANIDSASGFIVSTPINGFHRNSLEISRKDKGSERLYGVNLSFTLKNILKTGFLFYNSFFNHSFTPQKRFDKSGREFRSYSVFYDLILNGFNLFGEFNYNGKSIASINGLLFQATNDLIFTTTVRSYPSNFVNLHGYGFGEKAGKTQNEFGIYLGLKWRTFLGTINLYYDQFKFPYPIFRAVLPSAGDELFFNWISKPFKSSKFIFRFKEENKFVTGELNLFRTMVKRSRKSVRTELTFKAFKNLRLRERFELNYFNIRSMNLRENGFLFFHDIRYTHSNRLNIYGRIIFFKTDSFNSAVYEFENDLRGVLYNIPLYGKGFRWYLLFSYRLFSHYILSMKYSETIKYGVDFTSLSGEQLDNILSFQVDINF